jgi:predicted ATPase/class 3 adenylate cyclase
MRGWHTVEPAPLLPSGLVTFVFTDIEGSTTLLRTLGEAYPLLLADHNALLREVWRTNDGLEIKNAGDSFLAAFGSAASALVAGVAAERAIRDRVWPSQARVRIRVGIHTGIAFPHAGDYVALAVHQAARVMSAASGGSVLASEDCVHAAQDEAAVALGALGAFRLRDFDKPAYLFAVAATESELATSDAVRALPAEGHNLLRPSTSFVGREETLESLRARLAPRKLISLVGPGGVGKTRLAIELGLRAASDWRDGVWMADLSTVTDERRVITVLADAVGASSPDGDEHRALLAHLEDRSALVILDNCEQIGEIAARVVIDIVSRCAGVAIVATSREPIGCPPEEIWRLEPLPVTGECVELFVDRARRLVPSLEVDAADRAVIAEVCRELDGIPLAIELAAARVPLLTPSEILAGLKRRLTFLRSRDRTVPARQRTMQSLLDWGYDLLTLDEQTALQRLSLFFGSFDLDAATAALGHSGLVPDDVSEHVWSLADKSFVQPERGTNETRYRLLETVRQYAEAKLEDAGDGCESRRALAVAYLGRFPIAERGRRDWNTAFALEVDTMLALVPELLECDAYDEGYLITRLIADHRVATGRFALGREEVAAVLARPEVATPGLVRLQSIAVGLECDAGNLEDADAVLARATRVLKEVGPRDRLGPLSLAHPRSALAMRRDDTATLRSAKQALRLEAEEAEDAIARADLLLQLSLVLNHLGEVGAHDLMEEVSRLARLAGDQVLLASSLSAMAEYELRLGNRAGAVSYQAEALRVSAEQGLHLFTAFSLIIAARVADELDLAEVAIRLHTCAEVLLEEVGFTLLADDQAESDKMLAHARREMGDGEVGRLEAEGRDLALEDALEIADSIFNQVATT